MIREYKNGTYSLLAFYPALMCSMSAVSIMYALLMCIPIYTMVELQMSGEKFVSFLLIVSSKFLYCKLKLTLFIVMTIIGNVLGVIVGATSKDLVEAQNKVSTIIHLFVFCSK